VYCWGRGYEGQLGDGKGDHANRGGSDEPTLALLDAQAVAVAAGGRHTCAIMASRQVQCWGENEYGQLGDGTRTWRAAPVEVPDVSGWVP
jgi:alpha-tubulin suppressor-like RCC1 family protein